MNHDRFYRRSLAVAEAIVVGEPSWQRQLVEMLAHEIGAETVGFATWPKDQYAQTRSENEGGYPLTDEERSLWPQHLSDYPFFRRLLRDRDLRVTRTSDHFASMRQFHHTAVYSDMFAPRDARYQINFALLDDTELAIVGMYRQAHDFTDEELAGMEHGRAPIAAALAYRHSVVVLESRIGRRSRSASQLTARERQVLSLVATGLTNRQVAARLEVTERTVRKHLEDIYRRLDVTNRVAASRWWIKTHTSASPNTLVVADWID